MRYECYIVIWSNILLRHLGFFQLLLIRRNGAHSIIKSFSSSRSQVLLVQSLKLINPFYETPTQNV